PCKNGPRCRRLLRISYDEADAFRGVPWSFQHANRGLPKLQFETILHRNVRELRARLRPHVDLSPGARGKFLMTRDEIGMQVRFKNMTDHKATIGSRFQVHLHVPLRIDDDSLSFRSQHVRGVRKASQVKLFEIHEALSGECADRDARTNWV